MRSHIVATKTRKLRSHLFRSMVAAPPVAEGCCAPDVEGEEALACVTPDVLLLAGTGETITGA